MCLPKTPLRKGVLLCHGEFGVKTEKLSYFRVLEIRYIKRGMLQVMNSNMKKIIIKSQEMNPEGSQCRRCQGVREGKWSVHQCLLTLWKLSS